MPHQELKPYVLVRIQANDYAYIGQLIGFPLPDQTIMVRRVPGHPGTLAQLPIASLEVLANQKAWRWVHYAEVKGTGSFPVDMLRRETAAPVTFDPDTGERTKEGFIIAKVTGKRQVLWNAERWASFNWQIKPLCSEQLLDRD